MNGLTHFLLARIAEDRVRATLRECHISECDSIPQPDSEYTYPCNCGVSERLLAECEAKRRIVTEHQRLQAVVDQDELDPRATALCDGLAYAVRALATVYADHPDYRQEWAP